MHVLDFISTKPGLLPKDNPTKKPKLPLMLEPVIHLTTVTEPHGTPHLEKLKLSQAL